VDDPYLAVDLTADVFVAVIESAESYRRGRGEPAAWLFGIARHVVADEWRRNAKELRTAKRVRGCELIAEDDLAALHERIDGESSARRLYQELNGLPAGERAVLELVAVVGPAGGRRQRRRRVPAGRKDVPTALVHAGGPARGDVRQ
jgi:RNA polymerase sigma-70 factor (ECF subfamily)